MLSTWNGMWGISLAAVLHRYMDALHQKVEEELTYVSNTWKHVGVKNDKHLLHTYCIRCYSKHLWNFIIPVRRPYDFHFAGVTGVKLIPRTIQLPWTDHSIQELWFQCKKQTSSLPNLPPDHSIKANLIQLD